MKQMSTRNVVLAGSIAALCAVLVGCSSSGNGGDDDVAMPGDAMPEEVMALASDPRVRQLGSIVERTDVLLMPGVHVHYAISALDETASKSVLEEISCAGARCAALGETLDPTDLVSADLFDPGPDVPVSAADLRSRADGFHTASVRGAFTAAQIDMLLPDVALAETPEVLGYGLWGRHGVAGLSLADGPFSGRSGDIPFTGDMTVITPFAFGDVSGSNPAGAGSASWSGPAQVVALRTLRRQEGTVTLTITDLSKPAVSVGIDASGNPIGESAWTDLPLDGGRFVFGSAGDDYLEGNFHGAGHGEAYGVFDTGNFTGAFAARRAGQGE